MRLQLSTAETERRQKQRRGQCVQEIVHFVILSSLVIESAHLFCNFVIVCHLLVATISKFSSQKGGGGDGVETEACSPIGNSGSDRQPENMS